MAACTGVGTIIPACLRTASSSATTAGIAGDETRAVAGQRRALRQRMHGQQPGVVAVAHRRMQHRDRLGVPAQTQVALVGGDQRAALAGPADDLAQMLDAQHLAGGIARRVQVDQRRRLRAELGQRVGARAPARRPAGRRLRRWGRPVRAPRSGRRRSARPSSVGSHAMSSLVPITGSTASVGQPGDAVAAVQRSDRSDARSAGVPAVVG